MAEDARPTAIATAAAIAPVLDRLRITIARRIVDAAMPLVVEAGDAGPALPLLAILRNLLTGRTVELDDVRHVWLYQPEPADQPIGRLTDAGLVEVDVDRVGLGARGVELLHQLHDVSAGVIDALWAGHERRLSALAPVLGRLVDAAGPTGGRGFHVVAPVWEPSGTSTAVLVAERLTPLRFHRFDAHVEAWRGAGLSLAEVQALGPGAPRDEIEDATNGFAAAPFDSLDAGERWDLLAGLAALPG